MALWAFLFLSPLTFWRGTGIKFVQYMMYCMQPLVVLIVFYLDYLYLAPKYFVSGTHRYYLIVNLILLILLGVFLHEWLVYTNMVFPFPNMRQHDAIDVFTGSLYHTLNLAVFAGGSTALAVARRSVNDDQNKKELEAIRAKAELNSLRSQINPHFLLNTLNNVYALTTIDQKRAQDAIQQLSKLLRHMLYDNQEEMVTLSSEIQFLESYINLMKIRLAETVEVTFNHQIAKPDVKIAPHILISLIENAFKHGVSPSEHSFVHIDITVSDKELTCRIENSNHSKSSQDRSGHGIGLNQVQRRLDLAYPNRYVWEKGLSDDGTLYSSNIKIEL
jgi:two-component sensor histidine kinase